MKYSIEHLAYEPNRRAVRLGGEFITYVVKENSIWQIDDDLSKDHENFPSETVSEVIDKLLAYWGFNSRKAAFNHFLEESLKAIK
jgi:hypothetical protein